MARSKKKSTKRNNDDDVSSPSLLSATITDATTLSLEKRSQPSVEAAAVSTLTSESSPSLSATLLDLPLKITTRITSYLFPLNYSELFPSHSKSIAIMSALSRSCKLLRSSMELNLQGYVRRNTKQRWHRLPRPFVNRHFAEMVNGVTMEMAKKYMIPKSALVFGKYITRRSNRGKRYKVSLCYLSVPKCLLFLSSIYRTVGPTKAHW